MRILAVAVGLFLGACGAGATTTTQPVSGPHGDWELSEGDDAGVAVPEGNFRITLLLEEGTAGGVAACNSYGGSYTADEGFIQFGLMSQTEMACAELAMSAEHLFLRGLATVDTYGGR